MDFLQLCFREGALPITLPRFLSLSSRPALTLTFSLAVLFGSTAPLQAREKKDLEINLAAQRVERDAAGAESIAKDVSATPGDVVRYTATFQNNSLKSLRQLAPTLPIPRGMNYVPGSASPEPTSAT